MNSTDAPAAQASELAERLRTIISTEGMVPIEKLTPDAALDSLGIASADMMVILMAIEEQLGVHIPVHSELASLGEMKTVGELIGALTGYIARNPAGAR
jgi:acyl carrier protein